MEIGLMTEPQLGGSYEDLLELAHWTEANGLDSFMRSDHYLNMTVSEPATDALTSLAGLARETSGIALGVLVTPLTFRHPAVIAKTAATLHEMSGGRFRIGVGTGWMEGEHEAFGLELGPLGERFDRFEEALAYLWAAFGRSEGGFAGEHFRLADMEILPSVGAGAAVIVGGSGMHRTPRLAGTWADEYNMFISDEETIRHRIEVMAGAAEAAGRDPAEVIVSIALSPIVGEDEAEYRMRLADFAAERQVEPDDLARRLDERHIPHGTMDEVATGVAEIASWGITRIHLQQFQPLADIDLDHVALAARTIRQAL